MRETDLLRHNASHLVVFQSLMRTRNVTATAGELNMSQPAVSRALARLREMLDDPLFVRAPGGVVPTERARELAPRVSGIVEGLADLLSSEELDLATTERTFRIATTDYGAGTVLLDAARRFTAEAPRAGIEVVAFSGDALRELADGGLDLLLYGGDDLPESLRAEFLFEEDYTCICRKGHPVTGQVTDRQIPLDAFLAWPHALVTVFGGRFGLIDDALKARGVERRIALRLPYFSTAPLIVAQSDMLLTMPTRTAENFAAISDLQCFRAPVELPPFRYSQVWHPRTELDPAMIWLRQLIQACAAS